MLRKSLCTALATLALAGLSGCKEAGTGKSQFLSPLKPKHSRRSQRKPRRRRI